MTDDIKLPNLPLGCVDYPVHFPSGAKVMLVEAAEVYARAAVEADRQGRMPSDAEIQEVMAEHGRPNDEAGTVAQEPLIPSEIRETIQRALVAFCDSQLERQRALQAPEKKGVSIYGAARIAAQRNMDDADAAVNWLSAPVAAQPHVTDEMVTRFLGWHLPKDFAPDAGISFNPSPNPLCWPVGTNLFTDPQARAMLEYVLQGAPISAPALSAHPSAQDRVDAQRWRAYRGEWFAIGTHRKDDPVRYALRAMAMAGDLQTLDAAADQLIAARAAKEQP